MDHPREMLEIPAAIIENYANCGHFGFGLNFMRLRSVDWHVMIILIWKKDVRYGTIMWYL
jgi:hypothetical protein